MRQNSASGHMCDGKTQQPAGPLSKASTSVVKGLLKPHPHESRRKHCRSIIHSWKMRSDRELHSSEYKGFKVFPCRQLAQQVGVSFNHPYISLVSEKVLCAPGNFRDFLRLVSELLTSCILMSLPSMLYLSRPVPRWTFSDAAVFELPLLL